MTLNVPDIKSNFPLLHREINGKPLIYLDSANTSQKPQSVIDSMNDYYSLTNANVHRGSYQLAVEATQAMEDARDKVASFINAPNRCEVLLTKNATEAFNLVAQTWGRTNLNQGDAVVITELEHHANIIPWQMLVSEKGIDLRWIPINAEGHLDLSDLDMLLDGAKLLSITAVSNVLGTITPVSELVEAAHSAGALAMVDASQLTPHLPTDVQAMGADFLAFTGHKLLGPMGIGILWGRAELLDAMPPFLGGGEMIAQVTKEGFTTNELPWKFEAGTPMVGEAVGLGTAIDYLESLGMESVREHEVALTTYAMNSLMERYGDDLIIYGPIEPRARSGVMSIAYRNVHPHDLAQVLDAQNICVRAGNHCAKPLMKILGVPATTRVSPYIYNDESDIDALVDALATAGDMFGF